MSTVAQLFRDRVGDGHAGYTFEGTTYSWDAVVKESAQRAAILQNSLDPTRPKHVGVLLENTPDYLFWVGAAALTGSCIVGINPTRRGDELARDIRHTDCQMIISDEQNMGLFAGLDLGCRLTESWTSPRRPIIHY
ncbi:MAG: hypothetical protein RL119_1929 [Actinomycetota bacterium]